MDVGAGPIPPRVAQWIDRVRASQPDPPSPLLQTRAELDEGARHWQALADARGCAPSEPWLVELLRPLQDEPGGQAQLWWPGLGSQSWGLLARGPLEPRRVPVRGRHPLVHRGARAEQDGERVVVRGASLGSVAALTARILRRLSDPTAGPTASTTLSAWAQHHYFIVQLAPEGGPARVGACLEAIARELSLPPRADAQRVLGEQIARGRGVTLALCDLDKTQCINDTYGRALTEEIVRRIFDPARWVCQERGAHPFMYLSGDEFGVVGGPPPDAPSLPQTLAAVQRAFADVEQRLRVVVCADVNAEQLDRLVACSPRVVAATLHGQLGNANLLVDVAGLSDPDTAFTLIGERACAALGRRISTRPHWFNQGRFWVPSFTAGGIELTSDELEALGLTGADPDATFSELLTRAGLMCRLAKRRRGSVLIASSESEYRDRVSVFPPPRPVSRPGVTIPATFPVDGEVDSITGLLRQRILEREELPRGFETGEGVYLELSDISYASSLFVDKEYKAIKWGPTYEGRPLGARIMAINEFYGYEAGNNSVKLVGRAARAALPRPWRSCARLARKSPDKIQLVLPRCPPIAEVLGFLDAFQDIHREQLAEDLGVRLRALMIPLARARSPEQVLEDIEPLRLMAQDALPTYRSPRERAAPGTGNFLVVYEVDRDDVEGRSDFERRYRAMQEETSRRVAEEIQRSAPDRMTP